MSTRHAVVAAPGHGAVGGAIGAVGARDIDGYWLPALGDGAPQSSGALARTSSHISSHLSDFFAARTTLFALVHAALIAVGAVLLAAPHLRRRMSGLRTNHEGRMK